MRSEDRRDLATATMGAGGMAAGGVLRHGAVERMKVKPKVHLLGVLRNGSKGQKRAFLGGSVLGLAAAAPLGVGVTRLATGRDIEKRDERQRGFLSEGLRGSAEALGHRAQGATAPVPKEVRATQLGVAGGAGLGGSALARLALRGHGLSPAVAPVVGGLAAAGSLPITNKAIKNRGYVATPYGVKRAKTAAVKPSARASLDRGQPRSFREDLAKADSYLGSRTGYGTQRAAITVAGHPPIVGPLTAAAAAGKYAPPGQERKAAVRQWTMGSALPAAAGVGGAYAGARLAANSPRVERRAEQALKLKHAGENKARGWVGMAAKERKPWAAPTGLRASRALKPLTSSPARAAGAAAGFFGVKALTGLASGQSAISLNQRDQDRYNAKHGITKAAGQTKREQHKLADRKRTSAMLSAIGGTAGLTGVGLLAAGRKGPATTAGIIGGGFGGANALLTTPIQRAEAKAVDPFTKAENLAKAYHSDKLTHVALGSGGKKLRRISLKNRDAEHFDEMLGQQRSRLKRGHNVRTTATAHKFQHGDFEVGKKDSLEIKHRGEHKTLLGSYGDKGPLPKGLDRDTKMKAYEARYVAHGGDRADKYGRRAETAEGVRNAGLAGATVGGAAWLAARTKRGSKAAGRLAPKLKHHADTAAVASATVGGAAELYGEYARGRRSSYTNSPAGVAGSALRRMRDYTPDS